MEKKRSLRQRGLKRGRPQMEAEPRRGIEVSLTESDIAYAREVGSGNLSAALTMLIRKHRERNS